MNNSQLTKLYDFLDMKKNEISGCEGSLPEDLKEVSKYLRESQINLLIAMDKIKQKMYEVKS